MACLLLRTEVVCLLISLFVGVRCDCPEGQLWHSNASVCCLPIFDCSIDSEVQICTRNGEADRCVPCGSGRTNGYVTSSFNYLDHRCFDKEQKHNDCPRGDTVPIPEYQDLRCSQPCRCRYEDCFYGDSCACNIANKCKVNEELDPATGNCVSCQRGWHKPTEGCQPCLWNGTSKDWPIYKTTAVPVSVADNITVVVELPENNDPGYVLQKDAKPGSSPATTGDKDEGGVSMVAVIIAIVVMVAIGILIAVFLVILRRKIKSGDETSWAVRCYMKMTGSGSRQQQDTEAGISDETEENRTVPVQEVSPMVQSSGASDSGAGGAEGGPEMDTLHPLEVTADTNDAANTTTTPLIGGTEREDDETEQKTKE